MTSLASSFKPLLKSARKPILKPVVFGTLDALVRLSGRRVMTREGRIFNTSPTMGREDYMGLIRGRYEAAEISLLRRSFKDASTIVELGSNIGIVAYHALTERMVPGGQMICVEPNPHSLAALKANTARALKSVDARVSFINAAVGAPQLEQGPAPMVDFLARSNLSSGLVSQVAPQQNDKPPLSVPLTSLSDIVRDHNLDEYSLICDMEGGEIPLLYEDGPALKGCTQMLIELHDSALTGKDITPRDMLRRLKMLGFACEDRAANTYYLERRFGG
jgi:FkbM family methyltransferase